VSLGKGIGFLLLLAIFTGLYQVEILFAPSTRLALATQYLPCLILGIIGQGASIFCLRKRWQSTSTGEVFPLTPVFLISFLSLWQILNPQTADIFRLNASKILLGTSLGMLSALLLGSASACLRSFVFAQAVNSLVGLVTYRFAGFGIWSGGIFRTDMGTGNVLVAALMSVTAACCIVLPNEPFGRIGRAAVYLILISLVLTGTRNASLGLLILASYSFFKRAPINGCLCALASVACFMLRSSSKLAIGSMASSDVWRLAEMREGIQSIRRYPIFGAGIGNYLVTLPRPANASGADYGLLTTTKCQYLTWICQLGFIGALILVCVSLVMVARLIRQGQSEPISNVFACILIMWAAWGLFDDPFLIPNIMGNALFAFMLTALHFSRRVKDIDCPRKAIR
jgi:hypothetical protein